MNNINFQFDTNYSDANYSKKRNGKPESSFNSGDSIFPQVSNFQTSKNQWSSRSMQNTQWGSSNVIKKESSTSVNADNQNSTNAALILVDNFKSTKIDTQKSKNIAVIDDFKNKEIDVDGDGINDLSHGEIVSRYAGQNGDNIQKFDVTTIDPKDNQSKLNTDKINKSLETILKNPGDITDINLSSEISFSFKDLGKAINVPNLNKDNYKKYLPQIRAAVEEGCPEIAKSIKNLEDLSKKGIHISIAAGNNGEDSFNLLSLAQGDNIEIVGATDANNKKTGYTETGSTTFAQGTYDSKKVKGGFDINNDGVADVKNQEVSGKGNTDNALVNKFVGKDTDSVLVSENEMNDSVKNLISTLTGLSSDTTGKDFDKVYDPKKMKTTLEEIKANLKRDKNIDEKTKKALNEQIDFLTKVNNEALKQGKLLTLTLTPDGKIIPLYLDNKNGKIAYDPDNSNDGNAVSCIEGTSFAAPTNVSNRTEETSDETVEETSDENA